MPQTEELRDPVSERATCPCPCRTGKRLNKPERPIVRERTGRHGMGSHPFRPDLFSRLPNTLRGICSEEGDGKRDIAMYIRDPHVLMSMGPDKFFSTHRTPIVSGPTIIVLVKSVSSQRKTHSRMDQDEAAWRLSPSLPVPSHGDAALVCCGKAMHFPVPYLSGRRGCRDRSIVGTVTGTRSCRGLQRPGGWGQSLESGGKPPVQFPGIGETLVRHLVEHYLARGRSYVDLSVMHDNDAAIRCMKSSGFSVCRYFPSSERTRSTSRCSSPRCLRNR
jgi:hypothetical protein